MNFPPLPTKMTAREQTEQIQEEKEQEALERAKFVDDVTIAEVIPKEKLVVKTNERIIGPPPFEDSSDFEISPSTSLLQKEIIKVKNLSDKLHMKLNADKTKIFVTNYSQNYQFNPRITIPESTKPLEIVKTTKLVGVTLTSDLKFHQHVQIIVKKAYKKIWMLRRLKDFGVKQKDLLEIYKTEIRSSLEYCVPAWNSALTEEDKSEIERVQKTALKIVFGDEYNDYKNALDLSQLESLEKEEKDCASNLP